MKTYSQDLRERVIEAVDLGEMTHAEIVDVFHVALRTIGNWLALRRETGSVAPRPHGGGRRPIIAGKVESAVRQYLHRHPDATLAEIRSACGLNTSLKVIWETLRRWGLTRKKKTVRAAEQDSPEIQAERADWQANAPRLDASRLLAVDETGVTTQMHRTHGWGPSGERVVGSVPAGPRGSATLMGGMRLSGEVVALTYEGGTDVAAALAFVTTQLSRVLHRGDVVMWDNLPAHHSASVVDAIEKLGASVTWLPRYSPDLNPIEKLWSKTKAMLRGAAARTRDTLREALRKALQAVTKTDIEHWFKHCGYTQSKK